MKMPLNEMKPDATSISDRLRRWLRGDAGPTDEGRLESLAGEDPFLEEAMRGYRALPEADHQKALLRLRSNLSKRQKRNAPEVRRRMIWLRPLLAAALITGLAAAFWWLLSPAPKATTTELAQERTRTLSKEPAPFPTTPQALPSDQPEREEDTENSPTIALSENSPEAEAETPAAAGRPVPEEEGAQMPDQALTPQASSQAITRFAVPAPQALPEGGLDAWHGYLERNQRFPESAAAAGIRGNVILSFTAYANASPEHIEVVDSLGFGCDAEAVRLLREGPDWIPPSGMDSLVTRVEIPFPTLPFSQSEEKNNN